MITYLIIGICFAIVTMLISADNPDPIPVRWRWVIALLWPIYAVFFILVLFYLLIKK